MTTRTQRGVVLGAVLILLATLTLLGVAALLAGAVAMAMSGAAAQSAAAFEAAEAGIARVLAGARYDASAPVALPAAPVDASRLPGVTVELRVAPLQDARTRVVPQGFSLAADGAGFEALMFEVTATGRATRAGAAHVQGFYVVVPPTG